MRLTRRHLLKAGGAVLVTLPALGLPHFARAQDPAPVDLKSLKIEPTHRPLGRAIISNLIVREAPATSAKEVRKLKLNEVISITGEVSTAGPKAHNPIWYKTKDGWVHSGNVQPADDKPNKPLSQLQGESMWGEVTVPVSTLRSQTDEAAPARRNLFFGMVFRITQIAQDDAGKAWYRVADGNTGNIGFADARHLRVLTEDDFAPISPNVPLDKKRIEVDLKKQIATAYEDDKAVFTARVATGGRYRTPEGVRSFHTIPGDHRIFRKIAGQLMAGGTSGYDGYYLPGIGWVSYFTSSGIAFHSTYWHNDYGAPRSHGCVNMLPEDSHWVFRWTMPVFSATVQQMQINPRAEGSHVKVF